MNHIVIEYNQSDFADFSKAVKQYRLATTGTKPMKTKTTYILTEVINACAEIAYYATQRHYGNASPCLFSLLPPRIKDKVVKDVKAVLYGNRTPAQLHEAWASRKFKAVGNSYLSLKKHHPTAVLGFDRLSKEDQQGYEIFVEKVKSTCQNLTKPAPARVHFDRIDETSSVKPCGARLFESSAAECSSSVGQWLGPKALIEVYFDTFQQAQEFYRSLSSNV